MIVLASDDGGLNQDSSDDHGQKSRCEINYVESYGITIFCRPKKI